MNNQSGTAVTTFVKDKLTLSQMQKMVGGYIEVIKLPKSRRELVVNDEGKLYGMLPNHTATQLLQSEFGSMEVVQIVGDALVLCGKAKMGGR